MDLKSTIKQVLAFVFNFNVLSACKKINIKATIFQEEANAMNQIW